MATRSKRYDVNLTVRGKAKDASKIAAFAATYQFGAIFSGIREVYYIYRESSSRKGYDETLADVISVGKVLTTAGFKVKKIEVDEYPRGP